MDGSCGCSTPCNECLRWINCIKLLGIKIKIYHINKEGKPVEFDGKNWAKYKPPLTIW